MRLLRIFTPFILNDVLEFLAIILLGTSLQSLNIWPALNRARLNDIEAGVRMLSCHSACVRSQPRHWIGTVRTMYVMSLQKRWQKFVRKYLPVVTELHALLKFYCWHSGVESLLVFILFMASLTGASENHCLRLFLCLSFSRVMVLDQGKIIEYDSPSSLIACKGHFFAMARDASLVS